MKSLLAGALLAALCASCRSTPDYGRPLPPGWPALIELAPGEPRPAFGEEWYARAEILPALERSIAWTRKEYARQFFPIEGVTRERALASLERFRELLLESSGPSDLERALAEEFTVYKSAGWDGLGGGVLFTGYCTPILSGSLRQDGRHRFPLYALPSDLAKGPHGEILGRRFESGAIEPYPVRRAIEASGMLEGLQLELVWLADPLDAYIAHVNGSAFIELEDGTMLRLGYAGNNGREYTSLGQALVKDKRLEADEVGLSSIRIWAQENPELLASYLDRNERFVFFTPIEGNPRGSLNVEVSAGRTLATDKALFPRGAITFVAASLPADAIGATGGTGAAGPARYERFLFDQDTGGAIRTAGRADVYLGVGPEAEALAGQMRSEGQLYYLFLSGQPPDALRAEP